MALVIVGSTNPVKIAAAQALDAYGTFEYRGMDVSSGVSEQPWGDNETRSGALHRAIHALAAVPEASLGIGLEGGLRKDPWGLWSFTYCAIAHRVDGGMKYNLAKSAEFPLPSHWERQIRIRGDLGGFADEFAGETDIKRRQGMIGMLSKDIVTRKDLYRHAVVCAYLPLLRNEIYDP